MLTLPRGDDHGDRTLYTMLAHRLRGFEHCDAPTLYRHFVRVKGAISVRVGEVTVTYPRRAHNPILC